jgi:2-polyprenyl-6-methoxyphenol hydroxylase-like FAD-dependent oxidoreductase
MGHSRSVARSCSKSKLALKAKICQGDGHEELELGRRQVTIGERAARPASPAAAMTGSGAAEAADVVIVGGGPTGLMLAAELRLGGADAVVLERLPEISEIPKGNGMVGQIVSMLDYRGLVDRFRAETTYAGPVPQFSFGPLQLGFSRLDASPLHVMAIPQRRLEWVLDERLRELGGSVRRGHEVIALSRPGDEALAPFGARDEVPGDDLGVTLDVRGPGGDYRLRTRYLVGCDGAHSLVRKQAGIGFPGVTSSEITRIGRVLLPTVVIPPGGGEAEVPGVGRVRLMERVQTARGTYSFATLASLDKNAWPGTFIFFTREENSSAPADPDIPMTLDELRASARRVLGTDLPMTDPQWLTRTVGNSRQADRYRTGPVLLAGDAAHIFGAGGSLNVGLLDAINLGWKLAAQVRGWAADGLLDSYHAERHAAGRRAIMQTRAQKALSGSGEYADALRELFGELMQYGEPLRHVGAMMEGSDIRYEMPVGGRPLHPLLGRLAPNLELRTNGGETLVAELVRAARGVLLDLTESSVDVAAAPTAGAGGTNPLASAAWGWSDRVSVIAARPVAQPAPAAAMLIRPDGYVAWAAGPDAPDPAGGLHEALHAWFGPPGSSSPTPT